MTQALLLWWLQLAEDDSFSATRDPTGEAWVLAASEQDARALLEQQVGPVVVAGVECFDLDSARVAGARIPWRPML